jgi:hypothetical protein
MTLISSLEVKQLHGSLEECKEAELERERLDAVDGDDHLHDEEFVA